MKIEDIFSNIPILCTKSLILKKMTLKDAEDLFEYASDPEVTKYITWAPHKSIDDSIDFLKSVLRRYENNEVSEWGIVYKENNKFIGTCGYVLWVPVHSLAEIAFALSGEYWGKGLMTEAVKEVIKYGFEKMNLNRIYARCFMENIGSQKVLEKVGMKFEGILREQMFIKSKFSDMKIYSILRKEYHEQGFESKE
ncbi:MAG: GNAT family protein [Candidatus Celaenobacter polaris]|nr:GNAT family protein [Candidatus Celaenobacter polaris]